MVRTIAQIFRGYIWQPSSGCSQVTSGRTPSSFCSPPVPPLNTRGSNLPRLPRGPRCNMKRVQLPFRRGDVIADIHRIKTAWGVGGRGGCQTSTMPAIVAAPRHQSPRGSSSTERVNRGGSYRSVNLDVYLRVSYRGSSPSDTQDGDVGFRCARAVQ